MSSFSGGDDEPSVVEWAVVAVSVAVTLSLFGFVAWHAATTPSEAPPEVTVVDVQPGAAGTSVTVEVYNPADTGLASVTVRTDCDEETIRFQHVPTDARERGTIVCPASADDPTASIRSWITA